MHLDVAHSQEAARKLYLRCGFVITTETTAVCGGNAPEEQDHMVLDLLQKDKIVFEFATDRGKVRSRRAKQRCLSEVRRAL